jgi:hypothetical protein
MAGLSLFSARATTNIWLGTFSSAWGDPSNWSLGAPSPSDSIRIKGDANPPPKYLPNVSDAATNAFTVNNVDISFWGLNFSGSIGVSNLAPPFRILGNLTLHAGADVQDSYYFSHLLQVDGLTQVGIPELNPGTNGLADTAYLRLHNGQTKLNDLVVGGATNYVALMEVGTGNFGGYPDPLVEITGTTTIGPVSRCEGCELDHWSGQFIQTNGFIYLGTNGGNGRFIELPDHQALALTRGVFVGNEDGSGGTLQISSTFVVSEFLKIGTDHDFGQGAGAVGVFGPAYSLLPGQGQLYVTNASHTAYIDLIRGGVLQLYGGGFAQVDNLILTNGGTLIANAGTLLCSNVVNLENGANVTVTNGLLSAPTNVIVGAFNGSTGTVFVIGGTLAATNGVLGLGNDGTSTNGMGTGTATVTNGALLAQSLLLGSTAGGSGTLTVQSNAVVTVNSNMSVVSGSLLSTSSVLVANGSLMATNGLVQIGASGSGLLALSGGITTISQIQLGGTNSDSSGTLTICAGAVLRLLQRLSANYCLICDGDLDGTGSTIIIGEGHNAAMVVMAGTATNIANLVVGYSPNFTGSFTNSGLVQVSTNLVIGDCNSNALGIVVLDGGTLYVTNAAHSAILDVQNGTLVLNPGATLVVDNLLLTHSCGHFINNGGTLVTTNLVWDPNLDTDGDGQSNDAEARAGTDPFNPSSTFRMLGATILNHRDVRVDWTTAAGHSYVVQTNRIGQSQLYDLSPVIPANGPGEGTTNYIHIGGATNGTGFYRVRLVQ